jgi:hypothetical protein
MAGWLGKWRENHRGASDIGGAGVRRGQAVDEYFVATRLSPEGD